VKAYQKQILLLMSAAVAGHCQTRPDSSTSIEYRLGEGVSAPELIHKEAPLYSEEALKAKWQAVVKVSLIVGVDGKPQDIEVQKSGGLGLDERAVAAAKLWRFKPGLKEGAPVAVASYAELNFRLRRTRVTRMEFPTPAGVSAPRARVILYSPLLGEPCPDGTLSFRVGTDGLPSEVRVLRPANEPPTEIWLESVKTWRFNPALKDGVAVAVDAGLDWACDPWPTEP
jgi:TonB family protein